MIDKVDKSEKSELLTRRTAAVPTSGDEAGSVAIGERLELVRDELGMKQADLAAAVGVSLRTYHRYRSGEAPLGASELAQIAKLGIDLNWLVTGAGAMMRQETAPELQKHTHVLPGAGGFVIDEPLIVAAVVAIEAWLDERQLALPSETKGKIIALLVEDAMAHRQEERAARIRTQAGLMLRLVA